MDTKNFWCKKRCWPECVANLNTPQVLNERPLDVHKCINLKGEKERKQRLTWQSLLYYLLCLIISKNWFHQNAHLGLCFQSRLPPRLLPHLHVFLQEVFHHLNHNCHPNALFLLSSQYVNLCPTLMEKSADRAFFSQPFLRNYSTTFTSESFPNYISFFYDIFEKISAPQPVLLHCSSSPSSREDIVRPDGTPWCRGSP